MSALEQNPKSEARPTGVGPGDRLQAARIQQGLSLEDVANRMHLSPNILEAIEENEFEEITAPIFVKGYLRAYARIVALDEDDMIQQYIDYYSGEDPPISSTSNMAPELSVTDARIKWTTYLVVLVLIALLAAWWWNKSQEEEPVISLDSQPTESQAEPEGDAVAGADIEAVSENQAVPEQVETTVPEPDPEPEPPETAAIEAPGTDAPAGETEMPVVAAPAPLEADAAPDPEPVGETPQALSTTPEVAAGEAESAAPATASTPALIAPAGDDRLQLVVIADTWADIKDASGYQMIYDLLRANQTLELNGAAPFSVFLGNGHGVEIQFNGEAIEFSARIRDDNTARLTVGN